MSPARFERNLWRPQRRQNTFLSTNMSTNFELARSRMIEQQIRAWQVLDQRVLETMKSVPREDFVPAKYRRLAFADVNLPLGHGQVMMTPKIEGRLLQALALTGTEDVLEIGTGSGFLTACLAALSNSVHTIDIYPEFVETATDRLANHTAGNVSSECLDASNLPQELRFDAIAVTASLPIYDDRYARALNPGGRLFVITGDSPAMEAQCITRVGGNEWDHDSLFETDIPPMINAPTQPLFTF